MSDREAKSSDVIPNAFHERAKKAVPTEEESEPLTRKQKILKVVGITSVSLMCVFLISVGTVLGFFANKSDMAKKIIFRNIADPRNLIGGDPLATWVPATYLPDQHVINILLLGCDYDYEDQRPAAIKTVRGRSDAIIIARVDLDNNAISMLSIPRDTAVPIPGRRGYHKINSAHAFGGPALAMETIKNAFGIQIDHYATIHFDAFEKLVDAVGGVDVNVTKNLNYDDNWGNLHIHLKPGPQHLNGYKAMGYVRFRHSDSDLMRAQRQQEFVQSLRTRITKPSNFMKLPDVLNAIMNNLATDMSEDQLLTLANFARKTPHEKIELTTLPVNEGPSYVYVRNSEAEATIRRIFYNNDPMASVSINSGSKGEIAEVRSLGDGGHSSRRKKHTHESASSDHHDDMPTVEDEPKDSTPNEASDSGDKGSSSSTDAPKTNDGGNGGDKGGKEKSGGKEGKDGGGETKSEPAQKDPPPPTQPGTGA